jgi:phosphoribosylformylglycinamidine synthase
METSVAFEMAGAEVARVHLNDILEGRDRISNFDILVFVGGFSFGDHIAAGRVMAIKMKYRLSESVADFIHRGGLVLGICNGFQTMCKLGILPGLDDDYTAQRVTLTNNDCGTFRDAWVRLRVCESTACVFTRGLSRLELPIRHGEGKFLTDTPETLSLLKAGGQVVFQYVDEGGNPAQGFPDNPNGSTEAIAGICDPTGRVLGMMPHPEAFVIPEHHPNWTRCKGLGNPLPEPLGRRVFKNAVEYVRESRS